LAVYVHWPYCAAICPYCDFNVYKARGRDTTGLLAAIETDLRHWRTLTGPRRLTSLYFGGGTPSLMHPEQVGAIIDLCAALWGFAEEPEITLEANPTDAEASKFADFRSCGVERLSLGVQALDDASLKALGRFHTAREARDAAHLARQIFPRLSIDLIYARPEQTLTTWTEELAEALVLEADHISPYQLTIEPGTAFERAVKRGRIVPPVNDLAADFYALTQSILSEAGFDAYEVSNHARGHSARSSHNLAYWTSGDWIGVGPGAHGRLGWTEGRRAILSEKTPQAYIAALASGQSVWIEDEVLDQEAMRDEYWLMGLRLSDGISLQAAPGRPLAAGGLARASTAGYLWQDEDMVGLTEAGRMVADRVIADLILANT
jgi:putative oxygen-independent coproporphyrinogen III oxidase